MPIRRLKAKVKEATHALNALLREGGSACECDRVLVVYGTEAASIYYEDDQAPSSPAPSVCGPREK